MSVFRVRGVPIVLGMALLLLLLLPLAAAEYVVRDGDTLHSIASRELGAAARWPELMQLNGIQPDELRVGQVLQLPEPSTTGPAAPGDLPAVPADSGAPVLIRVGPEPAASPVRRMVDHVASLHLGPFLGVLFITAGLAWLLHAMAFRLAAWLLLLETRAGPCIQAGLAGGGSAVLALLTVFGASMLAGSKSGVTAVAQVVAPLLHLALLAMAAAVLLRPPHRRSVAALALLASVIVLGLGGLSLGLSCALLAW